MSLPQFQNITPQNYNFLNIEDTEERPYFFGLGLPSRFNCNKGFSEEMVLADDASFFDHGRKSKGINQNGESGMDSLSPKA